jgi:hypothetical protein
MERKLIEQAFYLMLIVAAIDTVLIERGLVLCPKHGLERVW